MLKNLSKMRHYLSNFRTNISGKKQIVYHANKFGIWSLFISIRFEIKRIVHDRPNIAVTQLICIVSVSQVSLVSESRFHGDNCNKCFSLRHRTLSKVRKKGAENKIQFQFCVVLVEVLPNLLAEFESHRRTDEPTNRRTVFASVKDERKF